MATLWRYTGNDSRDYPTLGFSVTPGDTLYLDGLPPDDRFVRADDDGNAEKDTEGRESADWRNPITEQSPEADRNGNVDHSITADEGATYHGASNDGRSADAMYAARDGGIHRADGLTVVKSTPQTPKEV